MCIGVASFGLIKSRDGLVTSRVFLTGISILSTEFVSVCMGKSVCNSEISIFWINNVIVIYNRLITHSASQRIPSASLIGQGQLSRNRARTQIDIACSLIVCPQ